MNHHTFPLLVKEIVLLHRLLFFAALLTGMSPLSDESSVGEFYSVLAGLDRGHIHSGDHAPN